MECVFVLGNLVSSKFIVGCRFGEYGIVYYFSVDFDFVEEVAYS